LAKYSREFGWFNSVITAKEWSSGLLMLLPMHPEKLKTFIVLTSKNLFSGFKCPDLRSIVSLSRGSAGQEVCPPPSLEVNSRAPRSDIFLVGNSLAMKKFHVSGLVSQYHRKFSNQLTEVEEYLPLLQ
jgi:hypothetical protein